MSKFKVGDRVRCIDNEDQEGKLEIGKEYTVTLVGANGIAIRHGATLVDYYDSRFELAASEKEPEQSTLPSFGVGWKLVCVESASALTVGKEYTVIRLAEDGDPVVIDDLGHHCSYEVHKFAEAQPTIAERVTLKIERSSLIYNYLDTKDTFERAMAAYNEACQAIRDNVKDGEKFVYTRYGEGYIVSRDKDGFTVDKIDMV